MSTRSLNAVDRRRRRQRQSPPRVWSHWASSLPYDTTLASAYLAALAAWAARHQTDPEVTVMLPVGLAAADEVAQVLRALNRARQQHHEQQNGFRARRSPRNF
jgi:hypothetical protein